MSLNEQHRKEVYQSMIIPSCLSCIGSIFIISMYFSFASLKSRPFQLITILSMFDLINSAAFLIPTYDAKDDSSICLTQSMILNFTSIGGVIWTSFMAFYLYLIIVKKKVLPKKAILVGLCSILLFCGINTIVPFFPTNAYGKVMG